jgi:pimeloyl-ACP methyl ester carboxylesterase
MKLVDLVSRRQIVAALLVAGLLASLWLAAALAVAYRLTRRHRAMFAEPAPTVPWGAIEGLRLKTRDGEELGGWSIPGKPAGASILLLHGNGGCRMSCMERAQILASQGCSVLLITLRALGDSTGERNDIGYSARHDVLAAVDLLEQRRPGKPIVIHGTSLGAAAAVFAARELGRRVQGYILESPYQDLKTAVRNRTENALPPLLDWLAYRGLLAVSSLVLPELEEISPLKAISGVPAEVPVLILAGGKDRSARPSEARALHGRIPSHAQLIVFDDAGHMTFPETHPGAYAEAIVGFVKSVVQSPRSSRAETRPLVVPPRGVILSGTDP